MNIKLFVFAIQLTLFVEKIIEIPIFYNFGTYDMKITIGNSNRYKILSLNMESDFIFFNYFSFKWLDSSVKRIGDETSMDILGEKADVQLIFTKIYLEDKNYTKIDNIYLYHVSVFTELSEFDSFPLSFKTKNESFSPIELLYKTNQIDKRGFGLLYDINEENGTLFIGSFPSELIVNQYKFQYRISIPVNESYSTWGCTLKEVVFHNNSFKVEKYAFFQANKEFIIVSRDFLKYLSNNFFKGYMKNGTCSFNSNKEKIQCECDYINNFPNLTFNFDGHIIEIANKNLFRQSNNNCLFTLQSYCNNWIFGISFLNLYFSYFDYDNKKIVFYSNTPFHFQTKQISYIYYLIIINIIQMSICIVCFFYIKIMFNGYKSNSFNNL